MFDNIDRRLRETGTYYKTNRNAGRQRFARNVKVEERVLNTVWEDPTLSTRLLACCRNTEMIPCFFKRVLFTHESCFTKCGIFNLRNHHELMQTRVLPILGNNVLGAVELPSNLNSVNYLDFLRNGLQDLLDDVQGRWRCTTLCLASSAMVGGKLPRKMDWGGLLRLHNSGLPRSPDLNPLVFYFVYSRQVLNIDDLRERVNNNILRIKLSVDVLEKLGFNFFKTNSRPDSHVLHTNNARSKDDNL
ncbi:hypothetical protein NQ318_008235 [Aromia moschata]|uniref:Uncharacterized protein n=1 Tax=Aromia moschata TaxID=1265417 RepID=A0AAV8Y5Y8_9CUCU|nr:hypothetical protein NQ318_008235 [Aromia moschata]